MTQQTVDIKVNPSEETICLGLLAVRFLLTGENSTGRIAAFELFAPGEQRLAAPAHSHNHYEGTIYGIDGVSTWTVDEKQIDVGPGQALSIPRGAIHRFDQERRADDLSKLIGLNMGLPKMLAHGTPCLTYWEQ